MQKRAVFSLKTMQFHDFDSIVVDPCCVKNKENIQNPLPVYRGGLLGSCRDERSGGNSRISTFLIGAPDGDDRIICTTGKGQVIDFFVSKGSKNMPLMLFDRKTKDGKWRSLQTTTWWTRRRDDELALFWARIATSHAFPESPIQYFSSKFCT
jgi:hypothetical protein